MAIKKNKQEFFGDVEASPYAQSHNEIEAARGPDLAFDSSGNAIVNYNNIFETLNYGELRGSFCRDEFAQRTLLMRPLLGMSSVDFHPREIRDADGLAVLRQLNQNGFPKATKGMIFDAIEEVAFSNVISPLKNWLLELGAKAAENRQPKEYLDTWMYRFLGVPFDDNNVNKNKYIMAVSRAFAISAVARGINSGCKVDSVLILEGNQGAGKSTAMRELCGANFFGDALPPMHSKDASSYIIGKWLIELAELSNINKAEVEIAKAFISRNEERFRPAYGRNEIVYPRSCVFVGTTNKMDYLRDSTGNRRFWPIEVGEINLELIREEREMLFGEAVLAMQSGEKWWLPREIEELAQQQQEQRLAIDEWQGVISEYCSGQRDVNISDIAYRCLMIESAAVNRQTQNRISDILASLNYKRNGKFSGGEHRGKARFTLHGQLFQDQLFAS